MLTKSVTDRVQREYRDVTHERVSAIVRGPLGFSTRRRGGYSYIETPEPEISALCQRYDIALPTAIPPRSEFRQEETA